MDLFNWIGALFLGATGRLIAPTSPTGLASYLGAFVVLAMMATVGRRRWPSWRAFRKVVFPKKIFGHASTRADLQFYVLNSVALTSAYGLAVASASFWAEGTMRTLTACFGSHDAPTTPVWLVLAVTTIVEIVMVDLGYWAGHYLLHRIPALWEFHKVHHSAEVMTPLTEWRQHPLEMMLMPNALAIANGLTYGGLTYLFGVAQPLTLWRTNVLLAVFFLTISHLRHSHVWLPFTGFLGRLVHSPAHHQIHHSTDPKHFDKNLGFALSIWDWLFGTLWIPREDERVVFGIGAESAEFHTMSGSLLGPFAKVARRVNPRDRAPETRDPPRPAGPSPSRPDASRDRAAAAG
ncbi:sterol desaturase family protein [Methylocapsa sp. S129]|uniref:sterol desaturase family protein n=1 Tax=Methylocapsa sp. S129 TaxID=1641869 RepID=UPI00131C99F1|nr:sterol desaturase family protein [Methylocapsa sp. S129]